MASVKPIPEGYSTVSLSLTFKDSAKALEFYQAAFGAQTIDRVPYPGGGGTMHATMKIGNSILMMGDEMQSPECPKSAETMGGSPISMYVYVENVDEAFKKAAAAGATVKMPVADMFWGDRCCSLTDPFGYSWMIATHVRDLSKDEIEQGAKDFMCQMAKTER